MNQSDGSAYVSTAEASRRLGLPEAVVRHYVERGILKGLEHDNLLMVAEESIQKFLRLMDGKEEDYDWLLRDYNKLLNNYLDLIKEHGKLAGQVGYLQAREQHLLEYKNTLAAREAEAEALRRSLSRSERIVTEVQKISQQMESENLSLSSYKARVAELEEEVRELIRYKERALENEGRVSELLKELGELRRSRDQEIENVRGEMRKAKRIAVKAKEYIKRLYAENHSVKAMLEKREAENERLAGDLEEMLNELNELRNMNFWRRLTGKGWK